MRLFLLFITQTLLFHSVAYAEGRGIVNWFKQDVLSRYAGAMSGGKVGPLFPWSQNQSVAIDAAEAQTEISHIVRSNPQIQVIQELARKHQVVVYLDGSTSFDLAFYALNLQRAKSHPDQFQSARLDPHFTNVFPFADTDSGFNLKVDGSLDSVEAFKKDLTARFPEPLMKFNFSNDLGYSVLPPYLIELTDGRVHERIFDVLLGKEPLYNYADPSVAKYDYLKSLLILTHAYSRYGLSGDEYLLNLFRSWAQAGSASIEWTATQKKEIEKLITLISTQAENIEVTQNLLKQIDGMINFQKLSPSLKRLFSKEVLTEKPLGKGSGLTAAQLGLTHVTHQTEWTFYKAITN